MPLDFESRSSHCWTLFNCSHWMVNFRSVPISAIKFVTACNVSCSILPCFDWQYFIPEVEIFQSFELCSLLGPPKGNLWFATSRNRNFTNLNLKSGHKYKFVCAFLTKNFFSIAVGLLHVCTDRMFCFNRIVGILTVTASCFSEET